jgi:hypothetical protein
VRQPRAQNHNKNPQAVNSINQPSNTPVNNQPFQPSNQPNKQTKQTPNDTTNAQSTNHLINQEPANQQRCQPKSVNQSIQSVISPPINQPINQYVSKQINQPRLAKSHATRPGRKAMDSWAWQLQAATVRCNRVLEVGIGISSLALPLWPLRLPGGARRRPAAQIANKQQASSHRACT